MTKEICLKCPIPPSVNDYWVGKGLGRGYAVKPAVTRFRAEIRVLWLQMGKPLLNGRLSAKIKFFPPDKRRRDIDNVLKGLLDGLQKAGFYEDDSQIDVLHIERCAVCPPGRLEVVIEEIGAT